MITVKKAAFSTVVVGALLISATSFAEAPKKAGLCKTCHGEGGAAPINDKYPKLAGQNKGYLIDSLKAYKDGKRAGGMSAIMVGQAKMLTDAEMDELATYYSKQ